MPELTVPDPSLVVLVGTARAGQSTFAARHFAPEEVVSRAAFGDEEAFLTALGARLSRGLLAVADTDAARPALRAPLVALAREFDLGTTALVLDLPRPLLEARGADPAAAVAQVAELRRTLPHLGAEHFGTVHVLRSPEEVDAATLRRAPLPPDRRELRGPFDFIGDVHGCLPELRELLGRLDYREGDAGLWTPPPGRTAVFLGDLTDRGPDSAGTLRLVMAMVRAGAALCVRGNHDEKLARALEGRRVSPAHGLGATLAQLEAAGPGLRAEVRAFLEALPAHLVLNGGRVVAAHAGLPERYQGRDSARARRFSLYGDVDGRVGEGGLPLRGDWAPGYGGEALVVYGHTPHTAPRWLGRTLNLDTGCAFGGHLSALRYPELEVLGVPARAVYAEPARPLPAPYGGGHDRCGVVPQRPWPEQTGAAPQEGEQA
ncbi:metallophosphoesterase [Deinococcus petrolearius]|uniref:Metallophosphoesterase n=1 Tax=Deinococcus petrolearius TaxID=1751295 RepID=A0ABW1DJJ2_9DEIO